MPLLPIAFAAEIKELTNIKQYILNPIITLLFSLAFLYFVFGIVRFLYNYGEKGPTEDGKRHLLWGTIGLAIMVTVYGLLHFLTATIKDITG